MSEGKEVGGHLVWSVAEVELGLSQNVRQAVPEPTGRERVEVSLFGGSMEPENPRNSRLENGDLKDLVKKWGRNVEKVKVGERERG